VTTLADGRQLVLAGESPCAECEVLIPEIYSAATNTWIPLANAPFSFPYYPHIYLLPDGRVLVAATAEAPIVSQVLDFSLGTWTAVGGAAVDGGSSAMYGPGKILKTGKSVDPDTVSQPSVATAYVLEMTQPSPSWRQMASTNFARTQHTMTMLPDDAARIASVSLLRFGSVTQSINMAQRYLPLTFSAGSGSLSVTAPANANLAPPGNYMLFLVDTTGVPSRAATVRF
jgi:hypothetical protein